MNNGEKNGLSNQIKMTSIRFIAGLWLLVLPLSMSYGADVTLTVGDSSGAPGSTGVSLEVNLDNPNNRVGSIQMDICDEENYLACMEQECETTERTSGFVCSTEEQANGCCRVVLFDLGSGSIAFGEGAVFSVRYDISEDAPTEECINLNPQGISMRDENKELLEVTSVSGEFCFSTDSTTTTTTITTPSIDVLQDPMWKSRWIAIPYLMVLEGNGTNFMPFKTRLSFEPPLAIVPCFYIVWDNFYIWNFVWIMPAWLAGFDDQTVTVTAATGDEMAEGDVEVKLLPFILNNPKPFVMFPALDGGML